LNKRELVTYFDAIGFHPSHRLGQNFLVDRNLAQKLVTLATVTQGDCVVEAGPGMGMISREILATGARLFAVEMDSRLGDYLQKTLGQEAGDAFHLIQGDAVEFPLAGQLDVEPLTVISNPPFAITGPWLAAMLDQGFPRKLALLLQKEAVERITAKSGNKHFGVLAIRLGAAYEVAGVHPVPPQSFYPAPKIDSQIVVFDRKANGVAFSKAFLGMVQQLFMQRRKQIGAKLRSLLQAETLVLWEQVLQRNGLNLQSRPEQIPTTVWTELSRI